MKDYYYLRSGYLHCIHPIDDAIKLNVMDIKADGQVKGLSFDKISSGEYQVSNVVVGYMTAFEGVKTHPQAKEVVIDEKMYCLNAKVHPSVKKYIVKDLTSGYKPTQVVKDVCEVITIGQKNPELLINNFYFIGPPGTGKSKDAEAIAHYLGLPFFVIGLSSGVTEETLRGVILPTLAENILSEEEKEAVNTITKLFPSDMSIDITPEAAFEQITGKKADSPWRMGPWSRRMEIPHP